MLIKNGRQFFLFTALLLLLIPLYSQDNRIYIETFIEKNRVNMNEDLRVTFVLHGNSEADSIPQWSIDGFKSQFEMMVPNHQRTWMIKNGKKSEKKITQFNYSFIVSCSEIGKYRIQGPLFQVNGKSISSGNFILEIKGAEENPWYDFEISEIPNSVWENQKIDFDIILHPRNKIENIYFLIPSLKDKQISLFNRTKIQTPYQMRVNDQIVEAELSETGGETTVTLPLSLIIRESGTFSFKDIRCGFKGVGLNSQTDVFGRYSMEDLLIPLKEGGSSLFVKSLPSKGRPDDFSGFVGDLSLKVTADPLKVKSGDPISLKIEIGNINDYSLDIPELKKWNQFEEFFRIPASRSPGKVINGNKEFLQTIRALNEDVSYIPEISLDYFNTTSGKYDVLTSEEIPIEVGKAVVVNEDQVIYNSTAGRELAIEYQDNRQFHNLKIEELKKDNRMIFKVILVLIILMNLLLTIFLILMKSSFIQNQQKRKQSDFELQFTKRLTEISSITDEKLAKECLIQWRNSLLTMNGDANQMKELLNLIDYLLFSVNNASEKGLYFIKNELIIYSDLIFQEGK